MYIVVLWGAVTLPMVAVFVLDDAFIPSEYMQSLAYALGAAFGLSIVIFLPLALLGEALAKKSKHTVWVFPAFLCLCAGATLVICVIALKSFLDAILGWGGLVLLILGLFVLYWAVLWAERVVWACWQKLREHMLG